jgi:type IX secretion system PorP/SprF family membrane protein
MKLSNKILFILIFTSSLIVRSQQMEYNSHYVFNPYLLNPSMIGDGEKNIFLGYRKQWAGFVGAPEIQQITFDSPLENKKSAIGFRVSNDITNIIARTSGYLTYKYKVRFSKESDLSFALSGGFFQTRILFDKIIAADKFESVLFESNQKYTGFDADFAFNYRNKNFVVGALAKNILQNTVVYFNDNDTKGLNYSFIRQYNIHAQYNFSLKSDNFHITPIFLLQSVQGIPFNYEGNVLLDYRNKYFFNLNYSHKNSVGVSASVLFDNSIQIAYTFELPTNSLLNYSFTSQEISIKFLLHKSQDFSKLKDIEDLKNQNNSLFEKTDFIEQKQLKLDLEINKNRDSINSLKDSLSNIVYGLERVTKNLKYDSKDLDSLIKSITESIKNDSTFEKAYNNNDEILNSDTNNLYSVIIGAFKDFKNAKDYKQIYIREYNISPKIIRNKNNSWYFLSDESSNNIKMLFKRIKELQNLDKKKIIPGHPWIYFE